MEEPNSEAQVEPKTETPTPTPNSELTPDYRREEKSSAAPWMMIGGAVLVLVGGAAFWLIKKGGKHTGEELDHFLIEPLTDIRKRMLYIHWVRDFVQDRIKTLELI